MLCSPPPVTTSELQILTEQPSLSTTWRLAEHKSYNQKCKEKAMLRLVGEVETQKRLFPHSCVVGQNQEGYLSAEVSQEEPGAPSPQWAPQPRIPVLGIEWFLAMKNSGDCNWVRQGLLESGATGLQGPILGRRAAAQKTPETKGEELNCLASGLTLKGSWWVPLFFCWAFPCHNLQEQACIKPESPSTCLILYFHAGDSEILYYPTCRPTPASLSSFSIETACLSSCCGFS